MPETCDIQTIFLRRGSVHNVKLNGYNYIAKSDTENMDTRLYRRDNKCKC